MRETRRRRFGKTWLVAVAASLVGITAACTTILGFDKDVVEQGRPPATPDGGDDPTAQEDGGGASVDPFDGAGGDADVPVDPPDANVFGAPDPSFGDGGTVTIDAKLPWESLQRYFVGGDCRGAIDGKQRIVVTCASTGPVDGGTDERTAVYRFSSEGAIDETFAAGRGAVFSHEYLPLIVARPNGGVLLAGYRYVDDASDPAAGKSSIRVLLENGAPDPSFGNEGVISPSIPGNEVGSDALVGVAVDGDRLVFAFTNPRLEYSPTSERFSGWIEVDGKTGSIGRVVNPRKAEFNGDFASAVVRLLGDRTVLIGAAISAPEAVYNPGQVSFTGFVGDHTETEFGDAGRTLVLTHGGSAGSYGWKLRTLGWKSADANHVFAASSRRVEILNGSQGTALSGAIVKADREGRLVADFGDGGVKDVPKAPAAAGADSSLEIWTAALAPDGKIVLGGRSIWPSLTISPFLVRLTADGDVDTTFGKDGWVTTGFGATASAHITDTFFTQSGRLVAIGMTYDGDTTRSVFVKQFR